MDKKVSASNIKIVDNDHIYIGSRQFISLERFLEAKETAKPKQVFVVTEYDDKGTEPIVSVFSRLSAAMEFKRYLNFCGRKCCIDEADIYHSFTIS